jgi:hypothetical protein
MNLRRAELLETETDGLHHERHVQSELSHGLHAFLVADDLTVNPFRAVPSPYCRAP